MKLEIGNFFVQFGRKSSLSIHDDYEVHGKVCFTKFDADGNLLERRIIKNRLVNAGRDVIRRAIVGQREVLLRGKFINAFGIGDKGTDGDGIVIPVQREDTSLNAEITAGGLFFKKGIDKATPFKDRIGLIGIQATLGKAPFAQPPFDIQFNEAGLFSLNQDTGLFTLFSKTTFKPAIEKLTTQIIQVLWLLEII